MENSTGSGVALTRTAQEGKEAFPVEVLAGVVSSLESV